MAKLDIDEIQSGFLSAAKMNEILTSIQTAIEQCVFRDGTAPNQMNASLDMNGGAILNVLTTDDDGSLVTRGYLDNIVAEHASGFVVSKIEAQDLEAAQTLVEFESIQYEPASNNLAVYVNGLRLFPGDSGYTETSPTSITLITPASGGETIEVQTNEYLSTVNLTAHTHPWSDITNIPIMATRWPTWTEVTEKPTTFTPATHTHATTDITTGVSFVDDKRGVFVQSAQPTATRVGDLWFW